MYFSITELINAGNAAVSETQISKFFLTKHATGPNPYPPQPPPPVDVGPKIWIPKYSSVQSACMF
jgi:hypothetical protein